MIWKENNAQARHLEYCEGYLTRRGITFAVKKVNMMQQENTFVMR